MADQLAYRMRQRPVRTAAATSTVVVSIFYLLAQMVGAGALVALLLGVESEALKALTIVGVGVLMIFYVTVGGMKGTTWVQIVKAVLLMAGTVLITVLVLAKFGFNLSELLGTAAENTGKGEAFLQPGLKYGVDTTSKIDFVSLGLALVLGTAGLPHILIRFYTVPTAQGRAEVGAVGDRADRLVLPDDAGARLRCRGPARHRPGERGRRPPAATWPRRCWPRRSAAATGPTGGAVLLALISAVAFATILAVVAGLTLTSASSVAHDLYATVFKRGQGHREGRGEGRPDRGVRDRWHRDRAGHPGAEAEHRVPGGAGLRGRGLGQPAVAALQPVLAAVQHPRRGVGIYGGLITCVVLVFFSPVVSRLARRRWSPGPTGRGSR